MLLFSFSFCQAGQNPDTATLEMATAGEVACPGGEEAFVRAIIRDSLRLRHRVSEEKKKEKKKVKKRARLTLPCN